MKDIICECGHSVTDHSDFGKNGCILCKCNKLTGQIYRAHIAKLEAVVEAAKKLDREMKKGDGKIIANTIPALEAAQELVNAIAALDGTNVPS